MSEERKPTPPSYPRPSYPFVRRPLVPVKGQTPLSTQNINRMQSRIPRPLRPLRTPVSPLQRVADLPKRSPVPTPPTTATSPGIQRRRPASSACQLAPLKRTKGSGFSVKGKHVQKMDEKQNDNQVQQKSNQEAKGETTKPVKTSEEAKPVVMHKREPKKGLLFNQASPPSLEFFQKEGLKTTPSKSFEDLSNGSRIPMLIKSSKPRQKTPSRPSRLNNSRPNEEKPDEVKVVEPTVASRAKPGSSNTTNDAISKPDERPSDAKNKQPPSLRPTIPHRLEPLLLSATNGDWTSEDLCAVEENPKNVFGRFSSELQKERHNMEELGGVLPSKFTPDSKSAEHDGMIPTSSEENQNPLDCSSSKFQMKCETMKPLGHIPPSRFTPVDISTEVDEMFSEPSQGFIPQHPVNNQTAIREMIEEMQRLKDHLKEVKARQCSKTKNKIVDIFDYRKDQELDQNADPVKYVQKMVNDMYVMVRDIDLDMSCVHQAAKEIVETMVERLKKSKSNFDETLLKHEKEILRLQGDNNELQYSLAEGEAKFKSLEKAMDLTNEEYEKLQKRNAEILEDNQRLEAECQKMNDDMMFRAKELGSEDLLEQNKRLEKENDKLKQGATFRARELTNLHFEIQRRDKRSSQLLDEYHDLWKDKSSLNLKFTALETELKQIEHSRLSLHEHNSALGCQIAAMEDHIRQLENRNSYLAGDLDESTSNESEESQNSGSEIDSDKKAEEIAEDTEPQHAGAVPNIGNTEHVLFLENGKIINGLAESSKKMPTAALDAINKVEKSSNFIIRDVKRYQSVENKAMPEQANKSVSILKMMSEKIQRLGNKSAEEQKCEDGFDDMVEIPDCSKSFAGMAGETAEETIQEAVEETLDKVIQSSACSKPFARMAEESITETMAASQPVVEGMLNQRIIPQDSSFKSHVEESNAEPFPEVAGNVAATDQEVAYEIPSLEIESLISSQENCGIEIIEPVAMIQLQTDENPLGELAVNTNNAQDNANEHSQDLQSNRLQVDWVIQQQQLKELQTIIDMLREKNAQLENEKVEIISEHQGFLLENMLEVKRLKKLEQYLNEKERLLQSKLKSNNELPKESRLELEEEADLYDECVKASNRVREIEDLLAKQDNMLSDLENDRNRLLKVNKDLRLEMAKMLAEDASLLGLPRTLQGLEDIVKQLRRSNVFCNGVRKKIRCYTKCDVAIEQLQRMKPDTLVISIGDVTLNEDEQPRPKAPITHEQLLIKKPKMIKRHRMKNMQNRLFQNPSVMGSTLNGSERAALPVATRPRHKRRNPSILLRCTQNLTRINEGRNELLEEKLDENFDESIDYSTKVPETNLVDGTGQTEATEIAMETLTAEINGIAVGRMDDTGMETVEINGIAVGRMDDTGMETVEINGIAVGRMGDTGMETVEINGIAVGRMDVTEMETVEINGIAVGRMDDTGMETVEINGIAVGRMDDTGMETVEINGIAVGRMDDTGMETVEINGIAVGRMDDTGMETVEINGIAVGRMGDTGMETVEINGIAVGRMDVTEMETVEINGIAVGRMDDTGMETVEINGIAVGPVDETRMETVEINGIAVGPVDETRMETVKINGIAVGRMDDTGMETVEINGIAVGRMDDTGMETVEINGIAVGPMDDTGMETVEINGIAVGRMDDTGLETVEINGIAVGPVDDTGMETVEINGIAVGRMDDTGMETVEINGIAVGPVDDTGMETVEINGIAVGRMDDTGLETVEINGIAVVPVDDTGMETVEINGIAVGPVDETGMETVEINGIAVGPVDDRGMETVEINGIAVGPVDETGMETVEINGIAVGPVDETRMETVKINGIAVGPVDETGMETVEINGIAVGQVNGIGIEELEGYAGEMLHGSSTATLSEIASAEKMMQKVNTEVSGETSCCKSADRMTEETVKAEMNIDQKDEEPLAESANQLFESARQLEILRKSLTKKPSKRKKKNVDRMA